MSSQTLLIVDSLLPLPSQTTSRNILLQASCSQHTEGSTVKQYVNGRGFPRAPDYATLKVHHEVNY